MNARRPGGLPRVSVAWLLGCLVPHGCSGRRRARPLCVPVGGGPPASRPRCELRSARRLEARPGPAAAHRHRGRSLRRPPHRWCLWFWCARPGPAAAHRHCGRSLWRSSAPSALASLALRRVAWCVLLQTSSIRGVFRVAFCPVVTNVVNPGAFSLIMVVFWLGLTTFVTEVLVRRFELRWFDDVCNVGRPLVARPGPVAAHGHRSQAPQSPHRCRVQTSLAALLRPDPISHVIPLRLFQTLNSNRWNCNVFWLC